MKFKIMFIAVMTGTVLISAGVAASSKITGASVGVGQAMYGRMLVDARGHSLYLFEKDTRGTSNCYGACASEWRPLITVGKPRARAGARASLLGQARRTDGRWQVTYKGHPLYTLISDTRKGQTRGEGVYVFGAEWYLVSPSGAKIKKGNSTTTGGDSGSGGYGP